MRISKFTFWRLCAIFSGLFIAGCFVLSAFVIRPEDRFVYLCAMVPVLVFFIYSEIRQMIYPLDLRIYIYWVFMFSVFSVAYGSSALSVILVCCSYLLGRKIHFFSTHKKLKSILAVIVYVLAVGFQFRLERAQLFDSLTELLFSLVAVFWMFLIWKKLLVRINQDVLEEVEKENISDYFEQAGFTERDKVMLREVLDGCKYEEIAINHELSLSSVKKRLAVLYKKLGVTCQIDFIIKFSANSTKV
ncbi:MAG: hypothetical protein MJ185_07675 [Treponema sp.]|nr:hypothetical protein [Treponema sp.]